MRSFTFLWIAICLCACGDQSGSQSESATTQIKVRVIRDITRYPIENIEVIVEREDLSAALAGGEFKASTLYRIMAESPEHRVEAWRAYSRELEALEFPSQKVICLASLSNEPWSDQFEAEVSEALRTHHLDQGTAVCAAPTRTGRGNRCEA